MFPYDSRAFLWLMLQDAGYDPARADFKVGRTFGPVRLDFVVAPATPGTRPALVISIWSRRSGSKEDRRRRDLRFPPGFVLQQYGNRGFRTLQLRLWVRRRNDFSARLFRNPGRILQEPPQPAAFAHTFKARKGKKAEANFRNNRFLKLARGCDGKLLFDRPSFRTVSLRRNSQLIQIKLPLEKSAGTS